MDAMTLIGLVCLSCRRGCCTACMDDGALEKNAASLLAGTDVNH